MTLPNILKEFNSKLYGFSSSKFSNELGAATRFNVAVLGAISADTVNQTHNLIHKMKNNKKVKLKRHWKLVTYMIGANDFCSEICRFDDQEKLIAKAGKDLTTVLTLLKKNLPRTLVNIVLPPDVSNLLSIKNRPIECYLLNLMECPCIISKKYAGTLQRSLETIKNWQKNIEKVVRREEFHDSDVS